MLKGQDCMVLLKLLAHERHTRATQRQLAKSLALSLSETNSCINRLEFAGLLRIDKDKNHYHPIVDAAKDFIAYGIKHSFPVRLGEFTRGIPTGIAAPIFQGKVVLGDDPIPVWPYATGKAKGVAVRPLYHTVPEAISNNPDAQFYNLLALVDVLRVGRARERKLATEMLDLLL